MPIAVIAEICARSRIVGTKALHAIPNGIVAAGILGYGHRTIVISFVIVAWCVRRSVGRAAVVAAA